MREDGWREEAGHLLGAPCRMQHLPESVCVSVFVFVFVCVCVCVCV